jgi:uncharacterized protein with PQ loop repeat
MSDGLHHYHLRKRHQIKTHPKASGHIVKLMDKFIFVVGAAAPIFTIPQIWKIYHSHEALGVSTITWGAYVVVNIFWIYYGAIHKEKAIIFTYALLLIVNSLVVLGSIIYR